MHYLRALMQAHGGVQPFRRKDFGKAEQCRPASSITMRKTLHLIWTCIAWALLVCDQVQEAFADQIDTLLRALE